MDQQSDRHVADIELGCTGAAAADVEPTRCCAVCTETTLAWVTVGSCGHSLVVCPGCLVRVRFVQGDRRCSVCGADCPSVLVVKTAGGVHGTAAALPAPPPASKEGNVGEYWYHGDTAAYFHDEQQYEEAKDACKKTRPRYRLWFLFVVLFGGAIWTGAPLSCAIARDMKGTAMKLLGYALGMCITVPIACVFWCPAAWRCHEPSRK